MARKKKDYYPTAEDLEQSEREIEMAEQERNVPQNEKPLYETDISRVTAEHAISKDYKKIRRRIQFHLNAAESMGNEERVAELRDTLGQVNEHQKADQNEIAAAYSVFPIKELLRSLREEIELTYVADIAIPDEIKSRVITYDSKSGLLGMSIEATCIVRTGKDGSVVRNADGDVHTIDGYVGQTELDNARFYMNAEINAAPNKELFERINTRLAQDAAYRKEVAQAFAKAPNQVFQPRLKEDLSEYLTLE